LQGHPGQFLSQFLDLQAHLLRRFGYRRIDGLGYRPVLPLPVAQVPKVNPKLLGDLRLALTTALELIDNQTLEFLTVPFPLMRSFRLLLHHLSFLSDPKSGAHSFGGRAT